MAALERLLADDGGLFASANTDSATVLSTRDGGLVSCPGGPEQLDDGSGAVRAISWAALDAIREQFSHLNVELRLTAENFDEGEQRQLQAVGVAGSRVILYLDRPSGRVVVKRSEVALGDLRSPLGPGTSRAFVDESAEWMLSHVLDERPLAPVWFPLPATTDLPMGTPAKVRSLGANGSPYGFAMGARRARRATGVFGGEPVRLIAPAGDDPALARWVEVPSGAPITVVTPDRRPRGDIQQAVEIASYGEELVRLVLHPESKMLGPGGGPCKAGTTGLLAPRPVRVAAVHLVGKEGNRLEEVTTGEVIDPDEVLIDYGDDASERFVIPVARAMGVRRVARETGIALSQVARILHGSSIPRLRTRSLLAATVTPWAAQQLGSAVRTVEPSGVLVSYLVTRQYKSANLLESRLTDHDYGFLVEAATNHDSTMFFGYASVPELNRDTLYSATQGIAATKVINTVSWEDLQVSGRLIVNQILEAIDRARACAFDVTTLNANVLFELGYAIAKEKPVWILLDETDSDAKAKWREFELLKTVGYVGWANADDIKAEFLSRRPDLDETTLYDDLIGPDVAPYEPASIFYVPAYNNTEPARLIERRLEHERSRGVRLVSSDPTESALNPLSWYAAKVYESQCTIVHFQAPRRELASLHNPRSALVAGFARGLERDLFMLAEDEYAPPLDYGDLLCVYSSGRRCQESLDNWLTLRDLRPRGGTRTPRVKLATELRTLRFGEHVAENEVDNLTDYFVATGAFDDVIADRNALFVGRKGTGKTANMLQAAARLSENTANLVVVIKPAAYEFTSLLALLERLPLSLQQYSIEGLWKFLLTSEIANSVLDNVEASPLPFTEEERRLLEYVESVGFRLRDDFSVRLEGTVTSLAGFGERDQSEAAGRDHLNEALHAQAISRLRLLLGPVLRDKQRVCLLIDNLDKGWERSANLDLLAQLLLGLLAAVGRVKLDFGKASSRREPINLTAVTFLRSDIFAHVLAQAREPDKIPASLVTWDDKEMLLRVIEERFLAARPENTDPGELWTRFFCPYVNGVVTREYLVARVLPRPRDLIYLCNAAVSAASNRGNDRIDEADIRAGELMYSQFAFESLLVENGITISLFKDVLFEFLGESAILSEQRVRELVTRAGVADDDLAEKVIGRLRAVSFIGIETAEDRYEYPEAGHATERANVLAKKLAAQRGATPRYAIHPAYRSYLEIDEG
jgi:Cdc6-like AAA superfamily ATPase